MCKLKSGIILKDRVFVPDYDSHTKMLTELKIKDTRANAEKLFVRAELYPVSGDMFSTIDTWVFNVDKDYRPDWFVEDYERQRMIEAVKMWAQEHIHIGKSDFELSSGTHYLKNCKDVTLKKAVSVPLMESSTVGVMQGSSTVGVMWGSSTVGVMRGSSIVAIPQDSSAKHESIILHENSTLKDCRTKTIYQSGEWKMELVNNEQTDKT